MISKWKKIRRETGVSKRKAKRLAYPRRYLRLRKKHGRTTNIPK